MAVLLGLVPLFSYLCPIAKDPLKNSKPRLYFNYMKEENTILSCYFIIIVSQEHLFLSMEQTKNFYCIKPLLIVSRHNNWARRDNA